MFGMFSGAAAFNQDISRWNVSKVIYMQGMFQGAAAFNQDITGWTTTALQYFMGMMFTGANAWNVAYERTDGTTNGPPSDWQAS